MHSESSREPSLSTPKATDFLERAKALLKKTSLAVVPLAAVMANDADAQPSMTADYSVVGSQTSSGWFTGALPVSESDAAASAAGSLTHVSGARSINDGLFWHYDSYYQETVPGYDTTGLRFAWGGQLQGGAISQDTLSAIVKFSVSFNQQSPVNEYDLPTVNYELKLGYGTSAYTPAEYASSPSSSASSYDYTSGSLSSTGTFELEKSLSATFYNDFDPGTELYWFLLLDVHWQNEFVSARNWTSGNYSKLNGDTLRVTLPEGLSSVSFNSTAVSAIPEPAHFAGIFGLLATGLLCWRRRQRTLAS